MSLLFSATIPGRPIVKKNTSRRVGHGRSTRVIYSPRYLAWEKNARAAILESFKGKCIDVPVCATFVFRFANRQAEADVSNLIEGPQDALVKAGVLKDDRLIYMVVGAKVFGGEPGVEIEISSIEQLEQVEEVA